MSRSRRTASTEALAAAVAGALVLSADDGAKAANIWYWHRARPMFAALTEAIERCPDGAVRAAADELLLTPGDPAAYHRVHELVTAALRTAPGGVDGVVDAAWALLAGSRMQHHLGAGYRAGARIDFAGLTAQLAAAPADPARSAGAAADAEAVVVIPFLDRSAEGHRARNLLACLLALQDQTVPRDRYRVVVVESDTEPRWRDRLGPYTDEYLFAPKSGLYNKWWMVNVGVLNSVGRPEMICILDGDALVDREFMARNLARFERPDTGAFLPYQDLFFLDDSASAWAIDQRCRQRNADVGWDGLRGFLIHRAQGVCVWLRRDIFDDIGGMDERFEGWGKGDMDLLLRLWLASAFYQFDDPMLHLSHPPAYDLKSNEDIPWLSYVPDGSPLGRLDRYVQLPVGG